MSSHDEEIAKYIEALASPDASERRAALRALAKMGQAAEPAIAALIDTFRDPVLELRERAVRVLARLGQTAVPALVEAVSHEDADVRKVAIVALGLIGPPAMVEAEAVLVQALEDDWLASTAATALARIRRRRRSRLARLGKLVPWLLPGWMVVALGCAVSGVLSWATEAVFGFPVEAAAASASVLGGVGSVLGAILGLARGGVRGVLLWAVVFGLGGLMAGFLLAGLLGGTIEPVRKALAR
jgi:HEAT repeat protein